MTIVGYDDRIEFDLNGNGICGEASADERGAWIVMNSWGADWQNEGAVYVPYAYAGPTFTNGRFSGDWWTPEVYNVRKITDLCAPLKSRWTTRTALNFT